MVRRLPARVLVLVAALGVVAIALAVGAIAAGRSSGHTGGGLGPDPRAVIVGVWEPVSVTGYTLPAAYPDGFQAARLTFARGGSWSGSDGCNRLGGTYRLDGEGRLRVPPFAMTEIGCANVPNGQVVTGADRVRVAGDSLVFLDAGGRELGRYTRVAP